MLLVVLIIIGYLGSILASFANTTNIINNEIPSETYNNIMNFLFMVFMFNPFTALIIIMSVIVITVVKINDIAQKIFN